MDRSGPTTKAERFQSVFKRRLCVPFGQSAPKEFSPWPPTDLWLISPLKQGLMGIPNGIQFSFVAETK